MRKAVEDLTGATFGMVTVLGRAADHVQPDGRIRAMWNCQCSCGKQFAVRADALKKLTSCGCQRNKDNALRQTRHSFAKTRLYNLYYGMHSRCYNTRAAEFGRYGGRGIAMCDEWKNDNESFFRWALEHGYDENDHRLSLERIDVDGNYSPDNCKWVAIEDQYDNRRNTIRMGNICLSRFCREAGLNYSQVLDRYKQTGDIVYAVGLKPKP